MKENINRFTIKIWVMLNNIKNHPPLNIKSVKDYKSIKTLTDIYPWLSSLDYCNQVKFKYEIIKNNPEIEYWDYLTYFPGRVLNKQNEYTTFDGTYYGVKISTFGRFANPKWNSIHVKSGSRIRAVENSYMGVTIQKHSALVHRAIACTFIPISSHYYNNEMYKDMEVNHEDGIKTKGKDKEKE